MLCLCHSGLNYCDCCEPYHKGTALPETPLILMRSRYSAYARGLAEYIIETTHPKNPLYEKDVKKWAGEILRFSKETRFVGLDILGHGEDWVEFSAHLIQGGQNVLLREKSRFAKLGGKWLYLSGVVSTQ